VSFFTSQASVSLCKSRATNNFGAPSFALAREEESAVVLTSATAERRKIACAGPLALAAWFGD
jgi:hypothetical protein